ncbi:MAG TPA: ankyrin repeat domain-containing protein [Blastocatellia bacterium]|jgi:ankyrin repeat protein|nr:ankyrin repeat domain-containing protein [Blastocatellia bacterium]
MLSRQIASLVFGLLLPAAVIAQTASQAGNQTGNEEFFAAARRGDAATVKAFLDKGADVNAKTQYGATALSFAADKGHVEVVRLLVERGADVNVKDSFYGEVPIGWACVRGHTEVVKILLDKGARGVDRVLMAGVDLGNAAMVKIALDKGGFVPETLTLALIRSEKAGKADIVDMIKKAGAVPPFQVDAETLQSYAGTYKGPVELTFAVKEGRLVGGVPGQNPFTLTPLNKTTFAPIEFDGATAIFNVEGGKVSSITWKQGGGSTVFNRVEQK